jgi:hypothetical protein
MGNVELGFPSHSFLLLWGGEDSEYRKEFE